MKQKQLATFALHTIKKLHHLIISYLTYLVVPSCVPPFENKKTKNSFRYITLECQSTNVMACLHGFSGKISAQVFGESQNGCLFWTLSTSYTTITRTKAEEPYCSGFLNITVQR
jgi:hypothetical protein